MAKSKATQSIVASDIMAKRLVTLDPEVDVFQAIKILVKNKISCLLYTSPSPRDLSTSRMPSSA